MQCSVCCALVARLRRTLVDVKLALHTVALLVSPISALAVLKMVLHTQQHSEACTFGEAYGAPRWLVLPVQQLHDHDGAHGGRGGEQARSENGVVCAARRLLQHPRLWVLVVRLRPHGVGREAVLALEGGGGGV